LIPAENVVVIAQHPRQVLRLEVVSPIGLVNDEEYSRPRVGALRFRLIVRRGIAHLAGCFPDHILLRGIGNLSALPGAKQGLLPPPQFSARLTSFRALS